MSLDDSIQKCFRLRFLGGGHREKEQLTTEIPQELGQVAAAFGKESPLVCKARNKRPPLLLEKYSSQGHLLSIQIKVIYQVLWFNKNCFSMICTVLRNLQLSISKFRSIISIFREREIILVKPEGQAAFLIKVYLLKSILGNG